MMRNYQFTAQHEREGGPGEGSGRGWPANERAADAW